ncbi:MAG: hypothetical protein A2Z18_09475 [Armatimonadetes bacterium RBG_16_58_9]|nr:MAG: hypothetical protein A2Z18_09475 [Armatimonadetes bacterium RBG_16_58_9]
MKERRVETAYNAVMRREHTFETIEHTADVGVIGKGQTRAEAFENAAYGMFCFVADLGAYPASTKRTIEVEAEDDVSLLQSFLSALIVLFEGDNMLPLDFDITELDGGHLKCEVSARPVGDDIEWLGPAIKAVTYHQMAVEEESGKWSARAILDV